ncbi:hypothetical protein A3Q56_05834 [Intoshia linei]|uniref:Calx-beta domain-containing protein n=1 Tax=Intoshia linei TaxID=1819745 RepID=A0A177AZ02_9BILA|nr:hypothetical protein A3Q56_05834 [Intoshia linei]
MEKILTCKQMSELARNSAKNELGLVTLSSGVFIPAMYIYSMTTRILLSILYGLLLLWCFLGVAIVADMFMCAIERITSKTKSVKTLTGQGKTQVRMVEIPVWNDTVANLTLMALGSSAPEILLSIIEIVSNNFCVGSLGPSTIVGSAAFNLMVITAICIISIPSPQIRRIKAIKVFCITAFFSVFAYIWVALIISYISPEEITLWEAIITLLLFPLLVILAYLTDKNFMIKTKHEEPTFQLTDKHLLGLNEEDRDDAISNIIKEIIKENPDMPEHDVKNIVIKSLKDQKKKSRLWYRINSTRMLGGGRKIITVLNDDVERVYQKVILHNNMDDKAVAQSDVKFSGKSDKKSVVQFYSSHIDALENIGQIDIKIIRQGNLKNSFQLHVFTTDGEAKVNEDYELVDKIVEFGPGEAEKTIFVNIIDDNEYEPDEHFYMEMEVLEEYHNQVTLGSISKINIVILNDDEPGTFEFSQPCYLEKESSDDISIAVIRRNGADGNAWVEWAIYNMSDNETPLSNGKLLFVHSEKIKTLKINKKEMALKDSNYIFKLLTVNEGSFIGEIKFTIVNFMEDKYLENISSRMANLKDKDLLEALEISTTSYSAQFRNALNVNGGEIEDATNIDYVMHFLTIIWKVIFAIIPPTQYAGGWLSFCISLTMIGLLTALIGDLASHFGSLIGLKDSVTAITFVALGTSLPDLFASKTAAITEENADNSIGNVTGSNSVNVFLGLGLPWTIAAIYWAIKGVAFDVDVGTLNTSVIIYTCMAIMCIVLLFVRRYVGLFGRAELGGTSPWKYIFAAFFVLLWIIYILVSSLQAYEYIAGL